MREVNTVNGILVTVQCNISPDSTPKTGTVNREYIFSFSIYFCNEYVQALVFFSFFFVAGSKCSGVLGQSTVYVHQHISFYILIIFSLGIFHILDVQCSEYLLLRIQFHVFILNASQ